MLPQRSIVPITDAFHDAFKKNHSLIFFFLRRRFPLLPWLRRIRYSLFIVVISNLTLSDFIVRLIQIFIIVLAELRQVVRSALQQPSNGGVANCDEGGGGNGVAKGGLQAAQLQAALAQLSHESGDASAARLREQAAEARGTRGAPW